MLGIMRKYKQSIVIKGVFAIIVLSFIGTMFLVWGEGEKGLEGSGYAVKVDRTKISYEDFQQKYNQLRNMYQQLSDQPLTPELEKQLGLRKLALESIISTTLMRKEADRMDIKVSKDEIVSAIAAIPAFQKDGAFDSRVYQETLRSNRLTPQSFEDGVKEELLLKKVQQKIMDEVKVSDAEALQAFKKRHDKINLLFASFDPAGVKAEIKITEQDLNAYLQKNPDQFRTPEQIGMSYVMLNPESVAAGLTVNNDEALSYYQKNIDRYQDQGNILPFEEVQARAKTDTLKFKAAKKAYEMAADALNRNLKSADLDAVAHMLGLRAEKTALFSMQQPPAAIAGESELLRKAFSLKTGELGGPVETAKGIYIFKIVDRKPAMIPPLAQVRSKVEKLVANEKSRELAHRKAIEALASLSEGKAPANLQETGFVSYSETGDIPKIGKSREIMEAVFDLTKASPTPEKPFKSGEIWFAVKLKDRTEADTSDFQKTKEQIKQSILTGKREEAMATRLKELRSKAKIEINPLLLAD